MAQAPRDQNFVPTLLLESSSTPGTVLSAKGDQATGRLLVDSAGGGTGDVVGPASSTDNAVARFDSTTGKLLQNSVVLIGDTGAITGALSLNLSGLTASEIVITDGSKNLVSAAVATYPSLTELTYLKGVTSAIQTQINAKGAGTVTSVGFTGGLISVATATTTPALTVAGTSGGIPYFSGTTTWATSALLAANAIVIGGGAGVAPATTTTGTGVLTALGVNVGSAGAFVTFNGALGTPSSGTVTNLTGTASININGTVGATTPAAGTFTTATANSFVPNLSTIPSNGLYLPAANTLGWAINSAAEVQLTSTALSPAVDGGNSLGTTTLGWQNLFANTGFVLNIENADWVATHTAGILTVGTGDLRVTTAGTNTASVVTVGGTQTLTAKTLTSPAINTGTIGTSLVPTSNDGAPLGNTTNQFSDLFLASGGVINWNNGDTTLTHASNLTTYAGGQWTFGANTAYFTETDNGNSGTADTVDWTLSNKQKSTLTGNCTFTFTAPGGPCSLILKLAQDATGSRTVTWPATVHWPSGTAPTLTTTASKVDIITFYWDGTTYFGNSSLNFTA